ncbi:MAG: alpha/beta hydrolase, partial [Gammaproteobacteria bacterium]|nr:alpha/beta hydrolase [Gammaproteobacteria bacterium]
SESVERYLSFGLALSVLCSEDVGRVEPGAIPASEQASFLRDAQVRTWLRACRHWPRNPVDPGFDTPVRTATPVLLLSGQLDPVTPPRWAELAARNFSHSRHLVVPGAAHIAGTTGCLPKLIGRFLRTSNPDAADDPCVERLVREPFFVNALGSRAAGEEPVNDPR